MLEVCGPRRSSRRSSIPWTGLDIPETALTTLTRAHAMLAEKHDLPDWHPPSWVLPMAAVGGGSADGTYTLRAIDEVCARPRPST